MTDKKISQLDAAADLVGAQIPIIQAGANKRASAELFVQPGDPVTALAETAEAKILTAEERAKLAAAPAILDPLRRSVEAASGGLNTVLYHHGEPNYVRLLPVQRYDDLGAAYTAEMGTGVLEAFLVNGTQKGYIAIGLYPASQSSGGYAVSQPQTDPWHTIDWDEAVAACAAMGAGWRLMSVWDWAAVAHSCMTGPGEPRGNTNWGRHHASTHERAQRVDASWPGNTAGTGRTLAGTGPNSWNHDGSPAGIADLVGNVWEWLSGLKIIDGNAHLSADNGDVLSEADWADQSFAMPADNTWGSLTTTSTQALKRALILPASGVTSPTGYYWASLSGERLPIRGGNWDNAGYAGLAALYLRSARSGRGWVFGFRPAFVP